MKKGFGPVPATMLVGAFVLSGCGDSSGVGSIAPLAGEELHGLLISAEEAGLPGGVVAGDTFLDGQAIPLGMATDGLQRQEGKCGQALTAVETAELDSVGAATRTIRGAAGGTVTVLLVSVEGRHSDSAAELYTDIAERCSADRLVDSGTGTEVEITAPDSGAQGYVLRIVATPAEETSVTVLVRELGNHRVHVTGYDSDQEATLAVLDAQVGRVEDWLAAEHSGT